MPIFLLKAKGAVFAAIPVNSTMIINIFSTLIDFIAFSFYGRWTGF